MTAFLIAHSDRRGRNVAQTTVAAKGESAARKLFRELHPDRIITVVGQREGRAPTRAERRWR